jgi:hypothetical protein
VEGAREIIFLFSLGAVNVAALLSSNYQSYRARELPSEFNETFYLAMTNLIILEGLALGAPILFVVGDDPTSFMLIRSLLVSIICFAVLLPMFVPKFTQVKDDKEKRHVANASSDINVARPSTGASNLASTDGVTTGARDGVSTGSESIADTSQVRGCVGISQIPTICSAEGTSHQRGTTFFRSQQSRFHRRWYYRFWCHIRCYNRCLKYCRYFVSVRKC